MSFQSAIEKIKEVFSKQPSVDELMNRYEQKLHDSTNEVVEMRVSVNNEVKPRLCVFITPSADINSVQEMYARVGIKLKKHIVTIGHKRNRVLYIDSDEFIKLDAKHQKYFKRTTTNQKIYKQNLNYSVKKERLR